MTRCYYGGESVTGAIRKLNATNFHELYEKYFAKGVSIPYTQVGYLSLPKAQRQEVKLVSFITSCTFKEGETRRKDENADKYTLLFLDIDNPAEARLLLADVEAVKRSLSPYNFILHKTISYTDKNPKLRLVVEVKPTEIENRYAIARFIADKLGLTNHTYDDEGNLVDVTEGFDSCSTVASQPFFRPVMFKGAERGTVICSRTKGCKEEGHDGALEMDDIPKSIVEQLVEEKKFSYTGDLSYDDDLTSLPIPDLDLAHAEEAIEELDPDAEDENGGSYYNWIQVCCALRHQFRSEEDAEQAFEVFDTWSARGEKYTTREATYRKWKSFVPSGKGKRPVTMRTVFKKAKDLGWNPTPMIEELKQSFEDWLIGEDDPTVLATDGIPRIASMPFKTEVLQNHYIAMLCDKMKQKGLKGITPAQIKKELNREVIKTAPKEDPDDQPDWMQPWVFLKPENTFYHTNNRMKLSVDAFNNSFSRELMHLIPEGVANPSGKPPVLPKDYALNVKHIQRADGIIYEPKRGASDSVLDIDGMKLFNIYTPSKVTPDADNSAEAEDIYMGHLHKLLESKWVSAAMDWECYAIQNVGWKIRFIKMIQSAGGAGKTMLVRIAEHALGAHNVTVVENSQIGKNFNAWAFNTAYIALEEIHSAGQNRQAFADTFKQISANDRISVERKHCDPIVTTNVANIVAFTNHVDAIHLDDSDRRFFVLRSLIQTKQQAAELADSGHFKQLGRLVDGDLVGGAVHFLQNYKISKDFDPNGRAPETSYRQDIVEDSENPLKAEIREIIEDSDYPTVNADLIHVTDLKDACASMLQKGKNITVYLRELGYERFTEGHTKAFRINGVRSPIWYHSETFDDLMGDPVEQMRELILDQLDE